MTRIIGHMVVKDEADRYLDASLAWNIPFFDVFHVYDDGSIDNTIDVVRKYPVLLSGRGEDTMSFSEHEGAFRQAAWNDMEEKCRPAVGDWIVSIDADEFLVGDVRVELERLAADAETKGKPSVKLPKHEVWQLSPPMIRTDGEWGNDSALRYVKWVSGGKIRNVKLGCGSIPSYGTTSPHKDVCSLSLLHFGYSIEGAAERKYLAYTGIQGNQHSKPHIESLRKKPKLVPYDGPMPNWWLGDG